MLADYSYYTETFGGSLIPAESWNRAAGDASDWICAATFGRLDSGTPEAYAEKVRRCCCEIAELIYQNVIQPVSSDSGMTGTPASVHSGNYSVTFRSTGETAASMLHGETAGLQDMLMQTARKHLSRTGLLYKGVDG